MNIVNDTAHGNQLSGPETELVQQEKEEYKLIDTFIRRKGLNLYAYNHATKELTEVKTKNKDTVSIIPDGNGGLTTNETAYEEASVDPRNTHFEALNRNSAIKRVKRYLLGEIKELCNLRKPGSINFF